MEIESKENGSKLHLSEYVFLNPFGDRCVSNGSQPS